MTYFRNKFDDEFLKLCNDIEPKGMDAVALGDYTNIFTEYKRHPGAPYVKVLPLVLYNILESSNSNDLSVENYLMLCEDDTDTAVTAIWDELYHKRHTDYICDVVFNMTGDFKEE